MEIIGDATHKFGDDLKASLNGGVRLQRRRHCGQLLPARPTPPRLTLDDLRAAAARTFDDLANAVGDICRLFEPRECWNFFKAAGYAYD
jgi:hypothetical protein